TKFNVHLLHPKNGTVHETMFNDDNLDNSDEEDTEENCEDEMEEDNGKIHSNEGL
ncbi:6835_t:CDS:1, partial [Paraglomus brasilianum]